MLNFFFLPTSLQLKKEGWQLFVLDHISSLIPILRNAYFSSRIQIRFFTLLQPARPFLFIYKRSGPFRRFKTFVFHCKKAFRHIPGLLNTVFTLFQVLFTLILQNLLKFKFYYFLYFKLKSERDKLNLGIDSFIPQWNQSQIIIINLEYLIHWLQGPQPLMSFTLKLTCCYFTPPWCPLGLSCQEYCCSLIL